MVSNRFQSGAKRISQPSTVAVKTRPPGRLQEDQRGRGHLCGRDVEEVPEPRLSDPRSGATRVEVREITTKAKKAKKASKKKKKKKKNHLKAEKAKTAKTKKTEKAKTKG